MAPRGRGGGRGGGGGGSRRGGLTPAAWQSNAPQSHFSLSEEARNTERHHGWNSDLKLRHSRVTFVSAGTSSAEELTQAPQEKRSDTSHSAPTRETDIASQTTLGPNQEKARSDSEPSAKQSATNIASAEIPMSKMTLNETDPVEASSSEAGPALTQIHETVAQGRQRRRMESHSARNELFFTDVNGSGMPVDTGLPRPRIQRSPSPTPSDSSEEIILFAGRHGPQSQMSKGQAPKFAPEQIPRQMPTDLQPSAKKTGRVVIDDPIGQSLLGSTSKQKLCLIDPQSATKAASDGYQLRNTNEERATNTKKLRRGKRGNASAKAAKEAEILADYVANTQDSDDLDGFAKGSGLNHRDLGGSDTAEWQDEEESSAFEEEADIVMNGTEDWDSADLQDFDDLSTSSEAPDAIAQIIYKRKRPSGKQYLVVGRGFTVDDARWLPLSALIMPGASEMIVEFEEEQAKFEQLLGDSDDSDESLTKDEQVARDLQEQMDDMEDERDLEERRIARKTDEQIAQLLSKQEELGLGSDSLILFNATDFDGDEVEEVPQLDGTLTTIRQSAPRARRKPGSRGTQPSFPSATTFAAVLDQDPYSGFDVMDHDRPSLRKLLKGRRGKLPIKLSDSEVEQSLNMAWENDRSKKKFRKQEREELRTQGLLGKKGKLDIKAKYSEGMTLEEVKKEIRNFLCSSLESLPLPPMAHGERKIVHEIANVFKMKSKSVGGGKSRSPVLYKTSRTTQYDEKALSILDSTLSSQRFLPRLDKGKRTSTALGKTRSGGFSSAGVSYRDGEVVGATAPELGQENRGRAMLEKMGWSTGKALGALNNDRGIVQPVAQVVKTTKAGLG